MSEMWERAMVDAFREMMRRVVLFMPKFMALLTFLVLGLVAGWLMKVLLLRILKAVRFDACVSGWG